MVVYVAFLRAINVAGHATVRMEALQGAFRAAGAGNVRTLIQSGNVVFETEARARAQVCRRIGDEVERLIGTEPTILFRSLREVKGLVAEDPFRGVRDRARAKCYVVFLARGARQMPAWPVRDPKERLVLIGASPRRTEVFVVSRQKPNGFFGFPNAFVERACGVPATSRNWTTVVRMADLNTA